MKSRKTTNQNMQQKAAVFSGVALFVMTLAASFAYGYVHSSLVIDGDAATTFENIQASQSLFRFEVLGWLIIVITDLIVAWGFYVFLKPFHQSYALLAGGLRFLYTAILAIAVSHLVITNNLIQNSSDRVAQQAMDSIIAFEAIWSFGLIIFGLHLITVGLIAIGTKKIPKVISLLVVIAGFSYSLLHFMYNFIPQIENFTEVLELILMAPMVIGELGFGIWLVVKGRKVTMD